MALHIVLRHKNDQTQKWGNHWIDEDIIDVITTSYEVAKALQDALKQGSSVYIHRCGWAGNSPLICAKVEIESVDWIDKKNALVKFCRQERLGIRPVCQPTEGTSFYLA